MNSSKIQYKIVNTGKIDTPNTNIYDHSLSWLGTGTSIIYSRSHEKTYILLQLHGLEI